MGFSSGWQGFSSGFPSGWTLPTLEKLCPSLLFYFKNPRLLRLLRHLWLLRILSLVRHLGLIQLSRQPFKNAILPSQPWAIWNNCRTTFFLCFRFLVIILFNLKQNIKIFNPTTIKPVAVVGHCFLDPFLYHW